MELENKEVMRNKKNLGKKKIYIDNEQTWKEREIGERIRERAKREKEEGKTVKIEYNKLWIEEEEWIWIEKENRLVKSRRKDRENFRKYT